MSEERDPTLRVGIDVHICRTSETGIYTFIWNLIERLRARPEAPSLTMILYGPDVVREPSSLARLRDKFGASHFRYFWTRIPPWLDAAAASGARTPSARLRAALDRRVMLRLWRKLSFAPKGPWKWFGHMIHDDRPPRWWGELDVLHHTAGVLLPMHPRANVLTINDLIPYHFKHLYKSELQWFGESFDRAKGMDAVLVYSQHTKADVIAVLGVEPERIHVVPLAAHRHFKPIDDRGRIAAVLARYGLDDRSYVLHVGSLEPRKNLARLVEAFYELVTDAPALRHKLVFSGPRFSTYHPIFEAIENLGLHDRVLWLGVVPFDDLPVLMNGAAVFVYPSLYEGFGLPPLEAMACGTPVIASRASSIPEVVGDAGILIDPYRVKEMTDALRRVLTDESLSARMRARGLERAASFSWDTAADLTLAVYRDAVRVSRSARPRAVAADELPRSQSLVNEWLFNHLSDQLAGEPE